MLTCVCTCVCVTYVYTHFQLFVAVPVASASTLSIPELHELLVSVGVPMIQPAYFRGLSRPPCLAVERVPAAVLRSLSALQQEGALHWDVVTTPQRLALLRLFDAYSTRERGRNCGKSNVLAVLTAACPITAGRRLKLETRAACAVCVAVAIF